MSGSKLQHGPQAMKPEGGWLVFDMRSNATAAENFRDPQVAMLAPTLYGFSVHVCLPSGTWTLDNTMTDLRDSSRSWRIDA